MRGANAFTCSTHEVFKMFNKKGSSMTAVVGIIGGTVAVLIGAYLLSPLATATTAANTSLANYASAQALVVNIPLFAVLGIIVTAISLMVLSALKE